MAAVADPNARSTPVQFRPNPAQLALGLSSPVTESSNMCF